MLRFIKLKKEEKERKLRQNLAKIHFFEFAPKCWSRVKGIFDKNLITRENIFVINLLYGPGFTGLLSCFFLTIKHSKSIWVQTKKKYVLQILSQFSCFLPFSAYLHKKCWKSICWIGFWVQSTHPNAGQNIQQSIQVGLKSEAKSKFFKILHARKTRQRMLQLWRWVNFFFDCLSFVRHVTSPSLSSWHQQARVLRLHSVGFVDAFSFLIIFDFLFPTCNRTCKLQGLWEREACHGWCRPGCSWCSVCWRWLSRNCGLGLEHDFGESSECWTSWHFPQPKQPNGKNSNFNNVILDMLCATIFRL